MSFSVGHRMELTSPEFPRTVCLLLLPLLSFLPISDKSALLVYRDANGGDHLSGFVPYWNAALTYLEDAFAGAAPPDNCSTYDAQP